LSNRAAMWSRSSIIGTDTSPVENSQGKFFEFALLLSCKYCGWTSRRFESEATRPLRRICPLIDRIWNIHNRPSLEPRRLILANRVQWGRMQSNPEKNWNGRKILWIRDWEFYVMMPERRIIIKPQRLSNEIANNSWQ
jgi:hypothetical protein